jgi:hypothetical protein
MLPLGYGKGGCPYLLLRCSLFKVPCVIRFCCRNSGMLPGAEKARTCKPPPKPHCSGLRAQDIILQSAARYLAHAYINH